MTTSSTGQPLVSIVINNYNYGRFLRDAIESALAQTYPDVEVVVVDDGSTDDSREITSSYECRVTAVFKENGGQASAFNAGFERCRGEVIIFLDSDDLLLPHIAEEVAEAFLAEPSLSRVQYRLEIVNALGQPTGAMTPAAGLAMPSGDLRKHMLRFPDDVRTPPTTGNAYSASVLRQLLPMPPVAYGRDGADLYLHTLTPLFGPVKSLRAAGGRYRVHDTNHNYRTHLDAGVARRIITRTHINHEYLVEYANKLRLPDAPQKSEEILSVTLLANQLFSLKQEPDLHPIPGDSVARITKRGVKAAAGRFDLPRRTRMLYMAWFVVTACSPKPLTNRLLTMAFQSEKRGFLGRLADL
jgi:glycosyltransferase involved in cell wall biosynthesis